MKLTHAETARICRGLGVLLHAGIPLAEGVFLLAQEETEVLSPVLTSLGNSMDAGASLAEAMEASAAFPAHVCGMVRIGQESGRMEESLETLAEFYEERCRTSRRIKSALSYPGMILLLMLAVIVVLLTKVLPVFEEVYVSLGSSMTGAAGGLLQLGAALEAGLPVLGVVLALLAGLVLLYTRHPGFREKLSAGLRSRFGDRGVLRKFNNARFARAMAMGMGSGLPMEEALELAQKLLSDVPGAAKRCASCAEAMKQGADLSEAMAAGELLPPAQSRMLLLGLRGGSADRVMADIAGRLLEDAEESLEEAVSRIEPAMVMVSSLLVGLILLTVMLPLVDIMSTIG